MVEKRTEVVQQKVVVGQKLWRVGHERTAPQFITITRVGRTCAYYKPYGSWEEKLYIKDIDGPHTSFFTSQETWAHRVAIRESWNRVYSKVARLHTCPEHLTLEEIHGILTLLETPK